MFRVYFYFKGIVCYQDVPGDDTNQAQICILNRFPGSILNGLMAISAPPTPPELSIVDQPRPVLWVDFVTKRRIQTQ